MLKWLIRGTIPLGAVVLVLLIRLYQDWTSPEVVRRLFVERLREQLPDTDVRVGSVRMRLWGGIAFEDLTLTRHGEPFLHAPSGRIRHDRERLTRGRLVMRELELDRPTLRVRRTGEDETNLSGLIRPSPGDDPVPAVVVTGATVILFDLGSSFDPADVVENVSLTLVPDASKPGPAWAFETAGRSGRFGPTSFAGRWEDGPGLRASVEFADVPIGPDLTGLIAEHFPASHDHLGGVTGRGRLAVELAYRPEAARPIRYTARVEIYGGRVKHPALPLPLEDVGIRAVCRDGSLTVERATARAGDSMVTLSLEMFGEGEAPESHVASDPSLPAMVGELERRLRKLNLTVDHLSVDDSLLEKLPPEMAFIKRMFAPQGMVSLGYDFRRDGGGRWARQCAIRPVRMRALYEEFRLPLSELNGEINLKLEPDRPNRLTVDLSAMAGTAPVTIRGSIVGEPPLAGIRLRIAGANLPLSEELIDALPDQYPKFVRELNPTAQGDFTADIWQEAGTPVVNKRFEVHIRDGHIRYNFFPVDVDVISGVLISTPAPSDATKMDGSGNASDGVGLIEFRDFRGRHGNATVLLSGSKGPGERGETLTLDVSVENLALGEHLEAALQSAGLCSIWSILSPSGHMNATAHVKILDDPDSTERMADVGLPFDPETDLELSLRTSGATIRPKFFTYRLDDFQGLVNYADGRLHLSECRAVHGPTTWTLKSADLLPRPDGGFWADLRELHAAPLPADADLIGALPPGLARVIDQLELRGNYRLWLRRLVVDDAEIGDDSCDRSRPPTRPEPVKPAGDTVVYWDANLDLLGASFSAGLDWEDVYGRLGCRGRYEGDRPGAVIGNLQFSRAWARGLPISDGLIHLTIDPREPDVLRLPKIHGRLFGGEVGGEARVRIDGDTLFDIKLNAMEVRLSEITRHYQLGPEALLEGSATAQLFLTNWPEEPGEVAVMHGGGNIDVPEGRMLNLPVLLDLLKVLNLRPPDRTAFEEAHAVFHVHGDRVTVSQLDLLGNAVSLGGEGGLNLDGSGAHFEFYTIWSRLLQDWLAAPVGDLTAALSKELFRIEVTGDIPDDLEYRKVAVPCVTDPLRRIAGRMTESRTPPRRMP